MTRPENSKTAVGSGSLDIHGRSCSAGDHGPSRESGGEALLEACLLGRTGYVATLLRIGAPLHATTEDGDTPLILSAVRGSTAVVELLLLAGADVDARNNHGITALMEAAFWGHADVVEVLLDNHADYHARDKQGRTALDWASHEGREDIVTVLTARPRVTNNKKREPNDPGSLASGDGQGQVSAGDDTGGTRPGGSPIQKACVTGSFEIQNYKEQLLPACPPRPTRSRKGQGIL